MAKVTSPLHSDSASGRLGGSLRYLRTRRLDVVKGRRGRGSEQNLPQRRQASIISAAAARWRAPADRGPEPTYAEYVAGISAEPWLFWCTDDLMQWDGNTLLVAR